MVFDVERDIAVGVGRALGNGGIVLAGRADGSGILSVGAGMNEQQRGGEIGDVEFEFVLLVGGIERGGDGALECSGQEGDSELDANS